MFKIIKESANWCAKQGVYTVTMFSIVLAATLAYFKDCDISTTLPTLVGLYLGHCATRAVSSHWAASRDPQADTDKVIKEVEGLATEVESKEK